MRFIGFLVLLGGGYAVAHALGASTGWALVEWLRICYREGWLGDERCNNEKPRAKMVKGIEAATELRQFRMRIGLTAPYGPQAVVAYESRKFRRSPHERWTVKCAWKARAKARKAEAKQAARTAAAAEREAAA